MLTRTCVAVAAVSLLIAAAGAHPGSEVPVHQSSGRPQPISVLPCQIALGGIAFVQGTIEGHAASLLFDSAGRGTLNSRWAKASQIKAQGGYQASGAGPAMVQASMVPDSTWRIGAAEFKTPAVVLDLTSLEPIFGRSIDGIVGIDFLRHYVVELDPRTNELRIFDTGNYRPSANAAAVPLEFDTNGYAGIQATLQFGDRRATGLFTIDTGSDGAVDLYRPFAERNGLPVHPAELDELSTGVGGHRHNRFERATALHMAGVNLLGPVVAFNDADDIPSAHHYAGLIGIEILRRFVVAFDFPHKQIYLSPLPTIAEPFVYDGSGMRMKAEGVNFQKVVVSRVVNSSPAEQAGVEPGDTVLLVNGGDAGKLGLEAIRDLCRKPGTLELVLERNGKEVKTRMVLKPLL